jgi:hypothetical protein
MTTRGFAAAVVVLAVVAGCGNGGSGPVPSTPTVEPPRTSAVTAPRTSAAPSTSRAAPIGVLPAELVGAWSRSEETTEVAYRFLADGRYRSIAILSQPRPGGIFEFRWQQDGTATVTGDRLQLLPTSSLTSRTDPDDPDGDYVDRPSDPEEQSFTWRTNGTTLVLTGADGAVEQLERQP